MRFPSALLAFVLFAPASFAAAPSYADVASDAWFGPAVAELANAGIVDPNKTHFRPGDPATRAEFVKLAMAVAKHPPGTPPLLSSFDDVPTYAWYFALLEEAGKEGWVRGDGNCYGTHPCRVYPRQGISRAEAAALLVRVLALERTGKTRHPFIDVGDPDWFAYAVFAMADRCILRGDETTMRIRPHAVLNRAEMAIFFQRARMALAQGSACS